MNRPQPLNRGVMIALLSFAFFGIGTYVVLNLFGDRGVAPPAQPRALRAAPARHDTLSIGMTQFPSTFHPQIDSMLAKTYILGFTRRPFTAYDHDWKLQCFLCTALPDIAEGTAEDVTITVPVDEDGNEVADGVEPAGTKDIATMRVTYTIRPDAVWGDGVPMTTKDVMFAWEVGRHPDTGVSNFEMYQKDIRAIEPVDDKSFTITLEKKICEYKGINDFAILPAHLERAVFDADPREYRNRTLYNADTTNPGLWYGPYLVTGVAAGQHVVLEPNPHWWGQKPYFKKIILRFIENTAALEANLLSGDIDMISGEMGLLVDQGIAFEQRHGQEYDVVFKSGLIYEHADMNLDNPILADLRVRQALLMAIDRAALTEGLFAGRQPVADSNINPLDTVYSDKVTRWPHDPARAAALLDEAGWTLGPDGIRRDKDGQRLSLELLTTAGNKTREQVQQVLQADWRKLGIDVPLRTEQPQTLFGESTTKRKFPAMVMYAWYSAPRNIPRTTLHSSMIPTEANAWAGQNYPGYRSARADEVLEDLETVCEPDANQALWDEIQALYTTDLPALPLYYRADVQVTPHWLEGPRLTGHQDVSTLWAEYWKQKGRP